MDFNKYFDKLFLSHELKLSKTQNEIWDIVLRELRFEPKEILFIDNKEKYFEYPKKMGINTILFENNNQVKKDVSNKLE